MRAQPYIVFRLFMLYAVTLERISSNELINGLLIPMFYLNSKSMGNVCGLDVHKDKYWKKVSYIAIILSEKTCAYYFIKQTLAFYSMLYCLGATFIEEIY